MKLFKQLLVFLVLLVLAIPASAQSYNLVSTALTGGTNNVALTTTNATFAVTIPAERANNIAVQVTMKMNAAGTTNVVFKFDESLDGTNWETSAHSLTITPAGTSDVTGVLNVAVGGIGYLRLRTVENPNTSSITNIVLKYAAKRGL